MVDAAPAQPPIPYVCHWLETQSALPQTVQRVHHSFAQQAAQFALQQSKEPEVQHPSETDNVQSPVVLVYGVEITKIEDHLALCLKDVHGHVHAELSMPAQALRQWLHILRAQYTKAQWHMTDWPEWLLEHSAITPQAPSGSALLH